MDEVLKSSIHIVPAAIKGSGGGSRATVGSWDWNSSTRFRCWCDADELFFITLYILQIKWGSWVFADFYSLTCFYRWWLVLCGCVRERVSVCFHACMMSFMKCVFFWHFNEFTNVFFSVCKRVLYSKTTRLHTVCSVNVFTLSSDKSSPIKHTPIHKVKKTIAARLLQLVIK